MDKHEPDIVLLYKQRNFKSLANMYLGTPIDIDENTIIHKIAKNLDKNAFEEISKYNSAAITYNIINMANKKNEFPLHIALESAEKYNRDQPNYEFIKYMIEVLGADPGKPDNQNRIIVVDSESDTRRQISTNDRINELNKTVINNIKKLTMLLDKKNDSNYKNTSSDISMNTNTKFIKDIVNYYNKQSISNTQNKESQEHFNQFFNMHLPTKQNDNFANNFAGGYNGKRRIKNFSSFNENGIGTDKNIIKSTRQRKNMSKYENEDLDDFKLPDDIKGKLTGGKQNYLRAIDSDIKHIKKKIKDRNEYKLMGEKLTNQRLFGGDNTELRKKQQHINQKIKELSYETDKMFGGASNKSNKSNKKNGNLRKKQNTKKQKNDTEIVFGGDDSSDFDDIDLETNQISSSYEEQNEPSDFNDSDVEIYNHKNDTYDEHVDDEHVDDDLEDSDLQNNYRENSFEEDSVNNIYENDSFENNFAHAMKRNYNMERVKHKREKSEKEKKIDEIYRSFIKTIMDFMSVDEEKARLYRSALKITIEEAHPELKGRQNDELKVKEMENIISNKEKLKTALKKIDINKIKNRMEQRKSEAEKRREEFKKIKEDKMKNKKPSKSTESTESSKSSKSSESSESLATSEKSESPKKTTKRKPKTKTAESGYLATDDIIISD